MTHTLLFQYQRNGIQKVSAFKEYLSNKHLSKNFLPADKESGRLLFRELHSKPKATLRFFFFSSLLRVYLVQGAVKFVVYDPVSEWI